LQDALLSKRIDRLAFFASDLVHFDGCDLRRQPIEDRKAMLRDALGPMSGGRILYVDYIIGRGAELFERMRAIGGEGIVSKRLGSLYRPAARATGSRQRYLRLAGS
jgi:bifunctional non-homologous end joining protein LigD